MASDKGKNGAENPGLSVVPETAEAPAFDSSIDYGLGWFAKELPKPIAKGSISAPEAIELKARRDIEADLNADIEKLVRTRNIVHNERLTFIRDIGKRFGLGPDTDFNIDDNGTVFHTHQHIFVTPAEAQAQQQAVAAAAEEPVAAAAPEPEPEQPSPPAN